MSWSNNDYFPQRMSGLIAPIYYPPPEALQEMEVGSATAPDMDAKSASRSCTTCSKAKAKCVKRAGQLVCERYAVGDARALLEWLLIMCWQMFEVEEGVPFPGTGTEASKGR